MNLMFVFLSACYCAPANNPLAIRQLEIRSGGIAPMSGSGNFDPATWAISRLAVAQVEATVLWSQATWPKKPDVFARRGSRHESRPIDVLFCALPRYWTAHRHHRYAHVVQESLAAH